MSDTQAGSCCYRISYRYQTVLMWDVRYQILMPIMKGVQIRGAGKFILALVQIPLEH